MLRRQACWVAAYLAMACGISARGADLVAGPMIGHVTDSSARIWLQISTAERVTVRAVTMDTGRTVSSIELDAQGPSPFVCDAPVSGLEPNRNYRIDILLGDKPLSLAQPLVIRSAPPPGDTSAFTVVLGANANAGPDRRKRVPALQAMADLHPRATLLLGNLDAMPAKEEEYPEKRRAAIRLYTDVERNGRLLPDIQALLQTSPTYGVWGGRDYGPDHAGKDWVYRDEAFVAFQRFWPNPTYGTPDVGGIFTNFSIGDVDFFLLDTRYNRDADGDPNRKGMLGDGQVAWLSKALQASRATFKIIAAPCPLLADTDGDTWAHFKSERDAFTQSVIDNRVSGVVFVSANPGFGELSAIVPDKKAQQGGQYPLFDLSVPPLNVPENAPTADTPAPANARRVGDAITGGGFGVLEFGGGSRDNRFLRLSVRAPDGKPTFQRTLFIGDLKTQ